MYKNVRFFKTPVAYGTGFVEGTFWPMIGSLSILKTPGFRVNSKFSRSTNTNSGEEVLQPSLKTHKPTINLPHIGGISPVTKE